MISLVLFDGDQDFITDVHKKLGTQRVAIVAATRDVSELETLCSQGRVDAVVFGPSLNEKDMISLAKTVSGDYPHIGVVFCPTKITASLLQKALRVGASDVVPRACEARELLAAVELAYAHSVRLLSAVQKTTASEQENADQAQLAKVVTFFSAKGGVGKTFVATNLGVGLSEQTKSDVILLDLNLQFGDVAVMLRMQPTHTIAEAAAAITRLDVDLMKGFLTTHSSGLKALLAPVEPDRSDAITSQEVAKIIGILRQMCDFLLIDTPPTFNDNVLTALDGSQEIVLVTSLDIPSLKNTKVCLNMMELLEYPVSKIKVLVNRSNARVGLTLKDVERSLGTKVDAVIPSDIMVPLTINKGIPILKDAPRNVVARRLANFAREIKDGHGTGAQKSKGKMAS